MVKYKSTFPDGEAVDAALTVAAKIEEHRQGSGTKFLKDDFTWAEPAAPSLTFGTTSGTACEGNDARLSDDRTPKAHAASHKSAGADAIKLDELAAPDDVTTLNASTSIHGLCPRLSGVSTEFLNGLGEWATPEGGSGGTGLTYPGSSTVYLNGNGAWSTPTASGSVFKPGIYIGRTGSGADYICDGVEDNVQIQAAIDAIPAGGVIYILPGTYYCAVRITKTGKSFSIIGIGTVNIIFTTSAALYNGLDFRGTCLFSETGTITSSVSQGDYVITLGSAGGLVAGDLINISNNIKWDATDNDQRCGEMYEIDSISGTTVTLTEPLIRAYSTSNGITVSGYHPIEIHIENINIKMGSESLDHMALTLMITKGSSVRDCKIENAGLAGISFYESYNMEISGCEIRHCLKAGSGYGISLWSGCAVAAVHHNHIANCRHCIAANTNTYINLNRKIHIHHNIIIGGTITGAQPVDAHQQTNDWVVDSNIIVCRSGLYCINQGAKYATITNNWLFGGQGGIAPRGDVSGKQVVIKDNYIFPLAGQGYIYRGFGTPVGTSMEIVGNHFYGGQYGVMLNDDSDEGESYLNITVKDNFMYDVAYDGVVIKANAADVNVDISNNYFKGIGGDAVYLDSNSNSFDFVAVSNNVIIDPNENNSGGSGVCLVNTSYAIVDGNKMYDSNSRSGYGVRTTGTSDYNVVINNVARGMGTKYSLVGEHNQDSGNITM